MVKFRGKTESGQWIYGMPLEKWDGSIWIDTGQSFGKDGFTSIDIFRVIPETVGMGVEIDGKWWFEGNVIKAERSIGIVVFEKDRFRIEWTNGNPDCWNDILRNHIYHSEIIGNKWDNQVLEATK